MVRGQSAGSVAGVSTLLGELFRKREPSCSAKLVFGFH